MNYFSGVGHGTLDQDASLLTSNRLFSAVDSQSRIKGVYNCLLLSFFCSINFFNVILFYFLSVISWPMIYKGPITLLIVDIELELM